MNRAVRIGDWTTQMLAYAVGLGLAWSFHELFIATGAWAWALYAFPFTIVPLGLALWLQIYLGRKFRDAKWRRRHAVGWMLFACLPVAELVAAEDLGFGAAYVLVVTSMALVQALRPWFVPLVLACPAVLAAVKLQNEPEHMVGFILLASVLGLHALVTFAERVAARKPTDPVVGRDRSSAGSFGGE